MSGIINTVKTEIKNVIFENIYIENLSAKNNVGIIVSNTGIVENLNFKDVTINAPNTDYVAIITKNENDKISNINLENIYITGKNYTASFIAYSYSTNIQTIIANNINITGKGPYIGGIFAYIANKGNAEATDITLSNSNISAVNSTYVGGIVAYIPYSTTNIMWISDVTLENNYVYGDSNVGGLGARLPYARNITAKGNTVSGKYYVGGLTAAIYDLYDAVFEEGNVENSSDYTGGITASSWNSATIYNVSVINSNITSNGDNTGGIIGGNSKTLYASYIEKSYIKGVDNVGALVGNNQAYMNDLYSIDCKVEGNDNVGGIVGTTGGNNINYVYRTYNNSEIKGNNNVGGITGTINNDHMTDTNNRTQVYTNYAVNKITGNSNVGGIVGNSITSQVINCYNNGDIEAIRPAGIAGQAVHKSVVENCYNIGTITKIQGDTNAVHFGIVAIVNEEDEIKNCYYLNGTVNNGNDIEECDGVTSKNSEELKALVPLLGNSFKEDTEEINNGYPILYWQ